MPGYSWNIIFFGNLKRATNISTLMSLSIFFLSEKISEIKILSVPIRLSIDKPRDMTESRNFLFCWSTLITRVRNTDRIKPWESNDTLSGISNEFTNLSRYRNNRFTPRHTLQILPHVQAIIIRISINVKKT